MGNGRMGSLVWTTPSALSSRSIASTFSARTAPPSASLAPTPITPAAADTWTSTWPIGRRRFRGRAFRQHLSVYDGLMTAQGEASRRA